MTGTAVLYMLLGAALVMFGVLAAALADRIRGLRVTRERPIVTQTPRVAPSRAATPIEVVEPKQVTPKPERQRATRVNVLTADDMIADDVITALVAAGYKKPLATEVVWGCSQADRTTIEDWTRAALRRACGGMS